MKFIFLCLITYLAFARAEWETLLPAASRGTLLDVSSNCDEQSCGILITWNTGDILKVDLMSHNVLTYHSSFNPVAFSQNITSVTYASDADSIVVTTANGVLYSMTLDDAGQSNAWQNYTVPQVSTGAVQVIPLSAQEVFNVLYITTNGSILEIDPAYGANTVVYKGIAAAAKVTTSLVWDFTTGIYPNQKKYYGVVTGFADGSTLFSSLGNPAYSFNIPLSPYTGPVAQLLIYRNNGTNWLLNLQTGSSNGGVSVFDVLQPTYLIANISINSATVMTILPDLELVDWLVVATSTGAIYKTPLKTILQGASWQLVSTPGLLNPSNAIADLQTVWINTGDADFSITPALLAINAFGSASVLPVTSSVWQVVAEPAVLMDPYAKIIKVQLMISSYDVLRQPYLQSHDHP